MTEHKTMLRWLEKRYTRAKPKHVPTIDAIRRLVEAAEEAHLALAGTTTRAAANPVSEPPYSPGHLPDAPPTPRAPRAFPVDDIEFSAIEVDETARYSYVVYLVDHPHAPNWDLLSEDHQAEWREQAREQLRVEKRAQDRYEEIYSHVPWGNLPEETRQTWIANERSALR